MPQKLEDDEHFDEDEEYGDEADEETSHVHHEAQHNLLDDELDEAEEVVVHEEKKEVRIVSDVASTRPAPSVAG